ncbi:MAG: PilZ domain-containing protein [Deltaproteobacteria bacterium]|nr:PilZ domain-containing protein [Deltaproteobacteria bacterium]
MAKKKKKDGSERRRFPRKEAEIKVRLRATKDRNVVFDAHLGSRDISIGGVFLESEFFIKAGTKLNVEFELAGLPETIEVKGEVIREERTTRGSRTKRSGFAIKFIEYYGDAKLLLATYFLAPKVRHFVTDYQKSGRKSRVRGEEERLIDIIVAWELNRYEEGQGWIMP